MSLKSFSSRATISRPLNFPVLNETLSILNKNHTHSEPHINMLFAIGVVLVFLCVLGGYAAMGAKLHVLWQPFEFIIIVGSAVGAFIIGNSKDILSNLGHNLKLMMSGSKYKKEDFIDILSILYMIFKLLKNKGVLAIETHIEKPEESDLFKTFPSIMADQAVMAFLCDYLRLISMGIEDPHQVDGIMETELERLHAEHSRVANAIQTTADAMPALGIVAAVLGVIKTMGAITEPPEVLGHLIGGALVGTFLGVFISYGFIGPIATSLKNILEMDHQYFLCIRSGFVAYLHGSPPVVAVEFARKSLFTQVRPSFDELESTVGQLPSVG